MRAWGHGDPEEDEIDGIQKSISEILEEHGPSVGIVGFSAGTAVAALITSLSEKRESVFDLKSKTKHPPLEFAIGFSSFKLEKNYFLILHTNRNPDAPLECCRDYEFDDRSGPVAPRTRVLGDPVPVPVYWDTLYSTESGFLNCFR
ncbi:hypothetical protein N7532_010690 [Penicillium argentinense]|uniref:Serine hydrolase domain-containing protein n=1 Tax=Penicillium argentinense TaxID=1131581 RepID=A0A9W9JXV8_9EURO|nr:uncharacterized protein N7532_010690 [Penicillium argentinense]KAJ5085919.1 hypothetical protein N7532_010690 [Penicillium argentinense]